MKVLGLVVEFNPFHNGHKYFIEKAKEEIIPDITIAIMSSSFSMRGDPMVIDKWSRAKFALDNGIDIILELPYLASVNSADYFCFNAINSLIDFGITDIAFGVELDNLVKLNQIKNIINSDSYNMIIKEHLNKGNSYSSSSFLAIKELTNDQEILDLYSLPNNTLAIGYLKAIEKSNKNINITLIKRIANNYYDENITNDKINSATSLRNLITEKTDISNYTNIDYPYLNPKSAEDALFELLKYNFIISTPEQLKKISGVNEGIENRINSFINVAKNYQDLIKLVQTRRYSINRIKRVFLNIILNINKEYENKYHYYLRILGMNKQGISYVNTLPKDIRKQIITNFKNLEDNYLVSNELKATKLFCLINNRQDLFINEFKIANIEGDPK